MSLDRLGSLRIGKEMPLFRSVVVLGHVWVEGMSRLRVIRVRVVVDATNRFAELENLVFLSMLVARYKVHVKQEPQFANETFVERRERVLQYFVGLTTT